MTVTPDSMTCAAAMLSLALNRGLRGNHRHPLTMFVAQSDQPGFDPDEGERLALVLCEVDAHACGHRPRNHRQRLRVRLQPKGPQLPQEDVCGDRANAIKGEQAEFEIVRVARAS